MCSSEGGGEQQPAKLSRWQCFVVSVRGKGHNMIMCGGITREKLQEFGLSMLLSYGWVSNCNMSFCLILSWVTFGKTTGLSPLARLHPSALQAASHALGVRAVSRVIAACF